MVSEYLPGSYFRMTVGDNRSLTTYLLLIILSVIVSADSFVPLAPLRGGSSMGRTGLLLTRFILIVFQIFPS